MPPVTNILSPDALVPLEGLDRTQIAVAGGKGAQLGELTWIDGVAVPPGFVVTTAAYRRAMPHAPEQPDRAAVLAAGITVPDDVAAAIHRAVAAYPSGTAFAVRSSATAEDLPSASSAGQHDTFLDVVGADAVVEAVGRCWASLFTERAVAYRLRNGIDERHVAMAVVVQEMVAARGPDGRAADGIVSGVLFTADPITSNRTVAAVEAVFGLGDALVSGTVNADSYRVRDGAVVDTTIAAEHRQPTLTDAEVLELVEIGRRIEAHFGAPQDIEWCLADGEFRIVQSRPITTLFPIPRADEGDDAAKPRVYISVGHQQMMTDAMKPLGLSVHQHVALAPMHEAGGRLFVEVADRLAAPAIRTPLLAMIGRSDPLIGDALQTIVDRGDLLPATSDHAPTAPSAPGAAPAPIAAPIPIPTDPGVVTALVDRTRASVAAMQREIRTTSGVETIDFIVADIQELKRLLVDAESTKVIMAGMEAAWWLNDRIEEWLGDKNVADTLSLSVPDNITSEMGLALIDVADVIRPHAEVVAYLEHVDDEHFLDDIASVRGGPECRAAIVGYLDTYGMRCAGEIDVTRPRWSERPDTLVPVILGNVRNLDPGAGQRRFEQGRQESAAKEAEILGRLRTLPDGEQKAADTKAAIDRVRTFAGYREYPKYGMVCRYFAYKQALLAEADRLVAAGVLGDREDCFFLTLPELRDVVVTGRVDDDLIHGRRESFRWYQSLTPPRVLTSDGEAVAGSYRRDDVPPGALVGLAVSAGTVEGRARVVVDMVDAVLERGDILVTAHTDPGWSPLFVAAAGLVTEVGGLMTHGAVIAREYGLPAVVGVEHATQLLRDGQRIRVHGTDGYVEVLPE